MILLSPSFIFFFFNDTATTEIYTLSLHDALPISNALASPQNAGVASTIQTVPDTIGYVELNYALSANPPMTYAYLNSTDRKSTRLNSSHSQISYAVFCLKKKKK